jgi:chaperone BCS1
MKKTKYDLFSSYNMIAMFLLCVTSLFVWYTYTNIDEIRLYGTSAYAWLNKQNPMIAGAISLWVLGVATFLARNIPQVIWTWIIKQTTVTLTLNNIDDVYDYFILWYHKTNRSDKSRTLLAKNGKWEEKNDSYSVVVSAGYGVHYFTFGGKIFKFEREIKETTMGKDVKETITLKTIGRTQAQFHNLLEEITPKILKDDMTKILKWNIGDGYWRNYGYQQSRTFDSVILPTQTKNQITDHIDNFLNNKNWYNAHGIPYRTGLVFHGPPGTGKTSLVSALCDKFKKPLHIMSLSGMTDNSLELALSLLPNNALVLIEDIDTYSVTTTRQSTSSIDDLSEMMGLTLSGLLNAIDGIIASDGRILIATTNHLELLDPALIRKGRFNLSVEIGMLTDNCFVEFFKTFFPEFDIPTGIEFKNDMTPAMLQSIILDNIDGPETVLSECIIQSPDLVIVNTSGS